MPCNLNIVLASLQVPGEVSYAPYSLSRLQLKVPSQYFSQVLKVGQVETVTGQCVLEAKQTNTHVSNLKHSNYKFVSPTYPPTYLPGILGEVKHFFQELLYPLTTPPLGES